MENKEIFSIFVSALEANFQVRHKLSGIPLNVNNALGNLKMQIVRHLSTLDSSELVGEVMNQVSAYFNELGNQLLLMSYSKDNGNDPNKPIEAAQVYNYIYTLVENIADLLCCEIPEHLFWDGDDDIDDAIVAETAEKDEKAEKSPKKKTQTELLEEINDKLSTIINILSKEIKYNKLGN